MKFVKTRIRSKRLVTRLRASTRLRVIGSRWKAVFPGAIIAESRYHDLVVVGLPETLNEPQLGDMGVDSALLSSGRPSLLVPGVDPLFEHMPEQVLFAWDGSRESIAALDNSAVFLSRAKSVMVVNVLVDSHLSDTAAQSNDRMVAYLKAHDISASPHILDFSKGQTVTSLLLDYANHSDCDLIVQGAYGHSRFRELFLGGTTRDMLHDATLPVLFSH